MDALFTEEFIDGFDRLDGSVKEIALKKIRKITENPESGKPLHRESKRFSERFVHYRIIYKIENGRIVFQKLAKRDEPDIYKPD